MQRVKVQQFADVLCIENSIVRVLFIVYFVYWSNSYCKKLYNATMRVIPAPRYYTSI